MEIRAAELHAAAVRGSRCSPRPLNVGVRRINDERRMMMRLTLARLFVAVLLLVAAPIASEAQSPRTKPQVGILPPGPIAERTHLWESFRRGLRALGYVEGQNIVLIFPSEEVTPERLPHLAAELAGLKVDVIVAATTGAVEAATKATRTIPIVAPVSIGLVEAGLVASLARPGGNVTGLNYMSSDLSGKRLELLTSVVPKVSRIAVLLNRAAPAALPQMREMEGAAGALGVQLKPIEVSSGRDLATAFQTAKKAGAGALIALDDALLFTHRARIVQLAAESRLPAVYGFEAFVDLGGLMSYAPDVADLYRRAATYVDKILKGARPADMPIEQPTTFRLVINLRTAKALRLSIPPTVLAQADRVIE
jgi:putative tryptophan/tyrosine transport system substrate-binding protein